MTENEKAKVMAKNQFALACMKMLVHDGSLDHYHQLNYNEPILLDERTDDIINNQWAMKVSSYDKESYIGRLLLTVTDINRVIHRDYKKPFKEYYGELLKSYPHLNKGYVQAIARNVIISEMMRDGTFCRRHMENVHFKKLDKAIKNFKKLIYKVADMPQLKLYDDYKEFDEDFNIDNPDVLSEGFLWYSMMSNEVAKLKYDNLKHVVSWILTDDLIVDSPEVKYDYEAYRRLRNDLCKSVSELIALGIQFAVL